MCFGVFWYRCCIWIFGCEDPSNCIQSYFCWNLQTGRFLKYQRWWCLYVLRSRSIVVLYLRVLYLPIFQVLRYGYLLLLGNRDPLKPLQESFRYRQDQSCQKPSRMENLQSKILKPQARQTHLALESTLITPVHIWYRFENRAMCYRTEYGTNFKFHLRHRDRLGSRPQHLLPLSSVTQRCPGTSRPDISQLRIQAVLDIKRMSYPLAWYHLSESTADS